MSLTIFAHFRALHFRVFPINLETRIKPPKHQNMQWNMQVNTIKMLLPYCSLRKAFVYLITMHISEIPYINYGSSFV